MTIDKDTIKKLAFNNGGIGLYQSGVIKWADDKSMIAFTDETLSIFAQAIIAEYVGSGEAVACPCCGEGEMYCNKCGTGVYTHPKQDDLQALVDKWCKEGETIDERLTRQRKYVTSEMKRHAETKKKLNGLQDENKKLREALEFYADEKQWCRGSDYGWKLEFNSFGRDGDGFEFAKQTLSTLIRSRL